jgi:aminobenzoyl-glutamate utilization protein B
MEVIDQTARFIDRNRENFTAISDQIWNFAELGYQEVRSAALHIEYLTKAGFRISENVADIPTAFIAEAGSGGPVIAILGEYDALSSLSQESGAFSCRPSDENTNGNGHGCGHHLLGTAAHLAAAAVKDALDRSGLPGTIRFYGCPAEEGGSGKTFMARAGLFDDVDAALSWHPAPVTSVWMQGTLANVQVYFRFTGKASHAAASPHLGRSALDAVELTSVGVNYLREHMLPDARVHYAVTNAGGTSPNVVQANAEVLYLIRAANGEEVKALYDRVCDVARGAALMTGCKLEIDFDKGCSNLVLNTTLNKLIHRHLSELAGPSFDEADFEFAAQMQERALLAEDIESMGRSFGQAMRKPRPLFEGVAPFNPDRDYPASGSTDVGDVSWITPTAQCLTACYAFGTPAHSWQWVAQGKSSIAHKGMLLAAKTLAASAIELLQSPELLAAARAEFNERLDGKTYVCPIPHSVNVLTKMQRA